MGAFITDTNPEDVAEQLRAVSRSSERRGRAGAAGVRRAVRGRRRRACGRRPAGSTSSASTPTTTAASCCRWRMEHTTRAAVARRTDGRVALASLQGDGDDRRARPSTTWPPGDPTAGRGYPAGVVVGLRDRLPAGGVSILVDTDVPVGRRPVLVGRADLLGGAGAARPRRPRAARARPRGAGPAGGERLRRRPDRHPRPVAPRCCARPATRSSSTPATAAASRCRSTWRPPGWPCSSSTPASRTTTPRAATATAGGSASRRPSGSASRCCATSTTSPRSAAPGRRQRRGRRPAAPGAAHRHRGRPGARGGRRAAGGRRPADDRADPHRRARVAARRLRDLGPAAGRLRGGGPRGRGARRPHGRRRVRRQRDRPGRRRRRSTGSSPPSRRAFDREGAAARHARSSPSRRDGARRLA